MSSHTTTRQAATWLHDWKFFFISPKLASILSNKVKFAAASFKILPTRVKRLFAPPPLLFSPGSQKRSPGKKAALSVSGFGSIVVAAVVVVLFLLL